MGVRAAWRALWDRGADHAPAIKAAPPRLASAWGGFEPGSGRQPWAPGARLDFAREAGNLADNAVVAIGLAWLRRQVPQGVLRVGRVLDDGTREPIDDHPALAVLRRPNPVWSLASTLGGTSDALCLDANSYWIKARNRGGKGLVSELYWVPNTAIELEYDQDPRALWPIARYRYQPGGLAEQNYEPRDVLHFRDGIDPEKPALGLSALRRQPRNVASLNHGERYSEAVLRKGHAGVVLTPEEALAAGYGNALSPDEAGMLAEKQRFERYLTGENAGGVHATTQPMRIQNAGLSPEEMGLDRILDRPETMVLAALGLNALVLGLPSSSGTRTYANYAEARRDAWESAVIPRQDLIAETLTQQLLYTLDDDGQPVPEWPGDGLDLVVYWDRSEVAALREDASERVTRATAVFTATLLPRDRALAEGGLEPVGGEEGEAYYGDPGTSPESEPGPDQGAMMPPDGWDTEEPDDTEPEPDDTADAAADEDEEPPVKALRGASGGKRRKVTGVRRTASGKDRPPVDGDHDGRIHDGTARETAAPPKQVMEVRAEATVRRVEKGPGETHYQVGSEHGYSVSRVKDGRAEWMRWADRWEPIHGAGDPHALAQRYALAGSQLTYRSRFVATAKPDLVTADPRRHLDAANDRDVTARVVGGHAEGRTAQAVRWESDQATFRAAWSEKARLEGHDWAATDAAPTSKADQKHAASALARGRIPLRVDYTGADGGGKETYRTSARSLRDAEMEDTLTPLREPGEHGRVRVAILGMPTAEQRRAAATAKKNRNGESSRGQEQ